ncbi:MAG: cellulase family glycosylhydrolase [Capsulimonadales bacterium]|nr:cellulase family glycosylhydrolase [Capsulimonadales bacterium]
MTVFRHWSLTLFGGVVALGLFLMGLSSPATAQALRVTRLAQPGVGKVHEFRIDGVPDAANPYDPDVIAVDAVFTAPSGKTLRQAAFRYQAFTRRLRNDNESLSPTGNPEWRLRFCPVETGAHQVRILVTRPGLPTVESGSVSFAVSGSAPGRGVGFVRIDAATKRFVTDAGNSLPLIGQNVCWHGARGTFDYDLWFPAMRRTRQNFARLWMWPISFGLESEADSRLNYRQDRAWQLDYVFDLAENNGIYLLLCLDYHGMFEVTPDYWGGNNYWPKHPYNRANGGPCAAQNDFFTDPTAKSLYRKRLRYLLARYGASRRLLAWEFFNEIDNVYRYLNAGDVARWHQEMGRWVRENDPYRHPVTTSLTGGSERADIWSIPEMDFTQYHSYGAERPLTTFADLTTTLVGRYDKPLLIGEFGTDWRGWNRPNDPHLRGFRQSLWGGFLGNGTGTAMSWWWENVYSEGLYPLYALVDRTEQWMRREGVSSPGFRAAGGAVLGERVAGARFDVTLVPDGGWGTPVPGTLPITAPDSAPLAGTRLNRFIHGTTHPDLRRPCRLSAWWDNNARLVMHLNSVADGAVLEVLVDGKSVFTRDLPNKDGQYTVVGEYDEDISVDLPAGRHEVEIRNAGRDWFHLDRITAVGVLPAEARTTPIAVGMTGNRAAAVYVLNPLIEFPANATLVNVAPVRGSVLILPGLAEGRYQASWGRTKDKWVGPTTGARTKDGLLVLPVPDFTEDLIGWIWRIGP